MPLIVRAPGRLPEGVESDQMSLTMDLTASILNLARADVPQDQTLDGIDLLGQVAAGKPAEDRTLFWRARRGDQSWKAVRDGSSKYLRRDHHDVIEEWLFDVDSDPGESRNIRSEHPDRVQQLQAKLAAWEVEVQPDR
ncbi:hypothetical protein BH23PLA1_BH23PLA1_30450 [soil metagenome]